MPTTKVQSPDGNVINVQHPEGATQEQIIQFAQKNYAQKAGTGQTTFGEFLEPLATVASSVVAEPIAGIAGIAQAVNPFADEGAGARAVEATRSALTYKPRTEKGQKLIGEIGEMVEPVGEKIQGAEKWLGDATFEATGSPTLAAAAASLPTAVLEGIGLATGKGIVKGTRGVKEGLNTRKVTKAIVESAPDIDTLKQTSRGLFEEIDAMGGTVIKSGTAPLARKASAIKGVRQRGAPAAYELVEEVKGLGGREVSLIELDDIREAAGTVAGSLNKNEARIGSTVIGIIDDYIDSLDPRMIKRSPGVDATQLGQKYRSARELWGRARKSEVIQEAFEKARNQASGFENGVRTQFRSILNNKKKSKFFNKAELDAMKQVVRGTNTQNVLKVLGKFGFGEGQASGMLGGSIGVAGGAAIGGPVGAVAVPVAGQSARKLAQIMTRRGAEFADLITRSGKNGRKIAEAYIKSTPRNARSAAELSELLLGKDLDKLPKIPLVDEAKKLAIQRAAELAGTVVAPQLTTTNTGE